MTQTRAPKGGRPRNTSDLEEQAAANLHSRDHTLEEIAKILTELTKKPFTVATIERALQRATRKRWLIRKPIFLRHKIPPAEMDAVERLLKLRPKSLDGLIRPPLREIRVVMGRSQKEFGAEAAAHVAHFINNANIVGVAWGTDVSSVVDGLEEALEAAWSWEPKASVRCFPVRGEPLGQSPLGESPSRLCERLNELMSRGSGPPALSLAGVPAMVPPLKGNVVAKLRLLAEIFGQFQDFQEIAIGETALLAKMDTCLTSANGLRDLSPWTRKCLTSDRSTNMWPLEQLLAGDVAGCALYKSGLTRGQRRSVDMLDRRWIGLQRSQLERTAADAFRLGRPGVILCASHPKKAEAVLRACELKLVSRLIISTQLAQEIEAQLTRSHSMPSA